MAKTQSNQEIFEDGDKEVSFYANFGMLEHIAASNHDPAELFATLSSGLMPPEGIVAVLEGAAPDDLDIIDLIDRYGLQECSILARHLLAHALIGDIKKSQALAQIETRALIDSLAPSTWANSKRLGLLLAATSLISTGAVCLIFKYFGLLTWLQTG